MDTVAKTARINSAIEVIQHTNNGMTVVSACEKVGMPRSTFYAVLKTNPQAFTEIQELIKASNIRQLFLILVNKTAMIQKLIEASIAEETSLRDRIAAMKELDRQEERLWATIPEHQPVDDDIHEILRSGPELSIKESRLSSL
jgi:hypothetical protein